MNTEIGKMKKEDLLKIIGKMKKNDLVKIIINKIGGRNEKININQIILSPGIRDFILEKKRNCKINNFIFNNTSSGNLIKGKKDKIMSLSKDEFKTLLEENPPKVSYDSSNEKYDENTNNYFPIHYYKIIDGRHRIARAIIEGIKEITVNIV
jgi:hypothetical protein